MSLSTADVNDLATAATALEEEGRLTEAGQLYRSALRELERSHGAEHPEVAAALNNLATVYHANGERARPEKYYLKALHLKEQIYGEHPETALTLNNLALFYKQQGRLREAGEAYQRALNCYQRTLGPSDPAVATVLENLALLWRSLADEADQRAKRIRDDLAEIDDNQKIDFDSACARFSLEIRQSRIHRLGVFAAELIPAGEDVIEYTGERVSRREAVRRHSSNRTYLMRLDSYWGIDGSRGGSGAEYVNHCCEPNLKVRRAGGRVWLASIRPVEPGEELTIDYNFHPDGERVACYCGSASCRGTINRKTRPSRKTPRLRRQSYAVRLISLEVPPAAGT